MRNKTVSVLSGAAGIILAGAIYTQVEKFPEYAIHASQYVKFLLLVLTILSGVLLLMSLFGREAGKPTWVKAPGHFLATAVLTIAMVMSLKYVGFYVAAAVYMAVLAPLLGLHRPVLLFVCPVLLLAVIYGVFVRFLGVAAQNLADAGHLLFEVCQVFHEPDQLEYDLRMKKRHNWWWLLLLLLIPLILWLLSRCDGIVVTPPEDFNDTIDIPVDPAVFHHPVQVMLTWHNYDDLDLHVKEPNGFEIYHRKKTDAETLGHLNFDRNVSVITDHPKEHISWPKTDKMLPGEYFVFVRNYKERSDSINDYQVDVIYDDTVYRFDLHEEITEMNTVGIVKFSWDPNAGLTILQTRVTPQTLTRSEAGL